MKLGKEKLVNPSLASFDKEKSMESNFWKATSLVALVQMAIVTALIVLTIAGIYKGDGDEVLGTIVAGTLLFTCFAALIRRRDVVIAGVIATVAIACFMFDNSRLTVLSLILVVVTTAAIATVLYAQQTDVPPKKSFFEIFVELLPLGVGMIIGGGWLWLNRSSLT